jgi:hypothetical protein
MGGNGIRNGPWRDAAAVLLAAVLAVAVVSLVVDGGRPALAADDCQYGPYGPYGAPCPKAQPSLSQVPFAAPSVGQFHLTGITLAGGRNPAGTLAFGLYGPGDVMCTSPVYASSVAVLGNGTYYSWAGPSTGSPQATAAGTWRWVVSYSGDANNEPISLPCGSYTVEVDKVHPGISASLGQTQITLGAPVSVNATLQGGYQPTGTFALRLFGPGDTTCSVAVDEDVVPVNGPGPYLATFTPDSAGVWRVTASYSGDTANAPTATTCGALTVDVLVPPPNDAFSNATHVTTLPFADTVDTVGATSEPNEPWGCGFPSRSVWYSFTPADDVLVSASLVGSGTLAVFVAGQPGLSGLGFLSCGIGTVGLERGVTYYFRVDGSSPAPITLRLEAQQPAYDELGGARTITFPRYTDSDDSKYATASASDPSCFGRGDTVWYAFTPTEDMRLEAAVQPWYGNQPTHFTLSAYTGAPGSLKQLDCSDDSFDGGGYRRPHVEFDARAGETVYFMVGSSGGTAGAGYYFGLQRPLEVTVTPDSKGGVTRDGVATVTGTIACSRAAGPGLSVTLDQVFAGRQRANGFASVYPPCGPAPTAWSATLTSSPILFGAGRGAVKVQVPSTCDDQGCQPGALYDPSSYDRTLTQEVSLRRK